MDALGDWVQADGRYITVFSKLIDDSAKWTYGQVVNISQEAFSMIRDFLKTQKGYGTETGIEKIQYGAVSPAFEDSVTYKNNIDILELSGNDALTPSDYLWTFSSRNNPLGLDLYSKSGSYKRIGGYVSNLSSYDTISFACFSNSDTILREFAYVSFDGEKAIYWDLSTSYASIRLSERVTSGMFDSCPFPVFDNSASLDSYLKTGVIDEAFLVSNYLDYAFETPVESAPDIQGRELETDGTIAIPGTEAEILELLTSIKNAVTAETRSEALAPAIDVTYGDKAGENEGEDDQTEIYPWVPDITRPLGVIQDIVRDMARGLADVKDKVVDGFQDLAEALVGVGALVSSIPASIASDISATDTANVQKYGFADLKSLFPFCLPFDLIDFIGVLSAEPVAPKFTWTFPGVARYGLPEVDIDIDLSKFDTVASLLRTMETLAFIVGLVMITRSHMIRG